MNSKPILFFADRLPPLIGGMEIHAQYFIEHFSEHASFPLMGTITKTGSGEDCLISSNQKCVIDIAKLSDNFKPAILFFNSGRWIEELSMLRKQFPTAIFLYRTGGNEILKAPLAKKNISDHRLRQAYWARTLNESVDFIFTNSLFTETRLCEIGIKCPFVRYIGGVKTAALRRKLPIRVGKTWRIFCAARFVPYKNHLLMLAVVHELILRGCNITLRLAGDGPLFVEIKEAVKQNMLESVVKFLGAIDNQAVCNEISKADVYMQLSIDYVTTVSGGEYVHSEGMGRSILEAISAGTFIIAGKSGALSEVVHGSRGVLIDLNDLKSAVDKVEQALLRLPISLPRVDDYSWEKLFMKYVTLMKDVTK